jgi:hypothetical protein
MKLTLLSLLLTVAFADKQAKLKQCKRICKDNEPNTAVICHPALTPKSTFKACSKGSAIAFSHACIPTCMGDTREDAGNSHQACKNYWKSAPTNNELSFCRFGYDRTLENFKGEEGKGEEQEQGKEHQTPENVQNGQAKRALLEEDSREDNAVQDLTTLALDTDDAWKEGGLLLVDKEDEISSSIQDNAVEEGKDEAALVFLSIDEEFFKDKEFLEVAEKEGFVSEQESVVAASFASDKESKSKEYVVKDIAAEAFIEIEAMQKHKENIEIEDATLDIEKHTLDMIRETNSPILPSE